ncbi:MAG: adenylate/guanylate cyclase domain-containing protein [Alphaproteobacteria bacterium]
MTETDAAKRAPKTGEILRHIAVDKAYPLRSRFQKLILPGLIAFSALLIFAVSFGTRDAIKEVYLTLAQRRVRALAGAIHQVAPAEWHALLSTSLITEFYGTPQGQKLARTIVDETKELQTGAVKIYAGDGTIIFDAEPGQIGRKSDFQTIKTVFRDNDPVLVESDDPNGVESYRLFVPLLNDQDTPDAIVEIDEPSRFLDQIILHNIFLPIAFPMLLLVAMIGGLLGLVIRAQQHINTRTAMLVSLRQQLEAFVSRGTVTAANQSLNTTLPSAVRTASTLLFVDVRNFSGFAESAAPESVVQFLNEITNVITSAVRERAGDIDKLIGDGALANFEGMEREKRAIAAAQAILKQLVELNLPRGVGIGIYSGDVIATVVGSGERKDFTVIGDSVNVAARLCSIALEGQIVVDCETIRNISPRLHGFGPEEVITVKGRDGLLKVCRWSIFDVR